MHVTHKTITARLLPSYLGFLPSWGFFGLKDISTLEKRLWNRTG